MWFHNQARECSNNLNGADLRIGLSNNKGIMSILADERLPIGWSETGNKTGQSCGVRH
jgi:hypothetical protein